MQSLSANKPLHLFTVETLDDGERKKPPYVTPADSEVSETVNTSCLPAKLPSQAAAVLMSSVYIRITYCLRVRKSKQDYTDVIFNPLTNRIPPLGADWNTYSRKNLDYKAAWNICILCKGPFTQSWVIVNLINVKTSFFLYWYCINVRNNCQNSEIRSSWVWIWLGFNHTQRHLYCFELDFHSVTANHWTAWTLTRPHAKWTGSSV